MGVSIEPGVDIERPVLRNVVDGQPVRLVPVPSVYGDDFPPYPAGMRVAAMGVEPFRTRPVVDAMAAPGLDLNAMDVTVRILRFQLVEGLGVALVQLQAVEHGVLFADIGAKGEVA